MNTVRVVERTLSQDICSDYGANKGYLLMDEDGNLLTDEDGNYLEWR